MVNSTRSGPFKTLEEYEDLKAGIPYRLVIIIKLNGPLGLRFPVTPRIDVSLVT